MSKGAEKQVVQINYQDSGSGNAIVLLHGFMENLEIWDELSTSLDKSYRVISIDLPGHGKSSIIDDTHTMEMMAGEVRNILEILGIKKCLLIGHSMGGYVAMAFAELYTKQLNALVLFHSHAAADNEEAKKNRDRLISVVEKDRINFIKEFIPDLFAPHNIEKFKKEIETQINIAFGTSKDGIIAAIRGMKVRKDRVNVLNKLTIPILIIAGKHDKRIPIDLISDQVDNPDYTATAILDDAGHMGFIETKQETIDLIMDFSDSIFP